MDLYIYYRAPLEQSEQLQKQATAMQAQLSQHYKIATALKRRPEDKDGMQTWMEVYLDVPDDFESVLTRAVAEHRLDSLINGPRHTERFEHILDFSPCA
jgi:hypothetical protein